jgi:hypothetical protein
MKQRWMLILAMGSSQGWALSNETAKIFDKKNRKLAAPPKSLRADKENPKLRFNDQVDRAPSSEAAIESQPVQSMPEFKDPELQSYWDNRVEKREDRLTKFAFSGQRTFGLGFVGAGAYGVFGMEFDFTAGQDWSFGFGLGTGMTYSTWGLHGRYFLKQGRLSSFIEAGYANWYMGKVPTSTEGDSSNYLLKRFVYQNGQPPGSASRANIVYPGLGLLYQNSSGLAAMAQLQYMISARDFSGGLFASSGIYYYF